MEPQPPEPTDPFYGPRPPVSSHGPGTPPAPRRRPAAVTAPLPYEADPYGSGGSRSGGRAESRRRRRRTRLALATLAATVAIAGAGLWAQGAVTSSPVAGHRNAPASPVRKQDLSSAAIANQNDPAIVDVVTTLGYQNGQAAGTGIVLTSNGEVLTNHHVVQGATTISVKLSNSSRTYPANVVGIDATGDIAVLQAQGASGLSTAPLGNSSAVTVGQSVVAIGNALNKPGPPTVTEGAVTALGRSITVSGDNGNVERLQNLLETSAPLQPGNSGGPLFDTTGDVIGINTAASSGAIPDAGTSDGFAIPINDALTIAHQIDAGHASDTVHIGPSAFLGIQVRSASQGAQGGFGGGASNGSGADTGGSNGSGVLVAGVEPGTPAASAGISTGDEIIAVGGTTVSSASDVTSALSTKHPGDTISITWVGQDNAQHQATVRLASGPTA
jgi:S1-C subfamily serine protease